MSNLPANVYGAVDIYGAAVRVSITSGTAVQEQDIGQFYSMYSMLFLNLHSHSARDVPSSTFSEAKQFVTILPAASCRNSNLAKII